MSPALLALETQDLAAASRVLRHWVAAPLEASATRLAGALEGCAAMAGSDPGGVAWAASYDRAARTALGATADAINAVDKLAAMFAQTARNYEAADAASTASDRRLIDAAVESLPTVGPSFWLSSCTPSAAGGSGGGPPGWSLIEHLVRYIWPDGHQDRLRAAAQAWATSADALQHGADDVTSAPQLAISDRLPEADDMWAVCHGVAGHVYDLASVHRALAAACEQLAGHIDDAHAAIEHELAGLVEWSVGIEVTGALVSVFTLGIAEGPTQVAETARVAASANRVAALIERFIALARVGAQAVAGLVERAGTVSARLRPVLDAKLSEATVAAVGRFRTVRLTDEAGALGRILAESEPDVVLFADREAARKGLGSELASASNRFFRDATSKSRDFKIGEVQEGYRMEFFSPADNPGYGKLYVQIIDPDGVILEEFKDTLGPEGLIERKWVRGGPR